MRTSNISRKSAIEGKTRKATSNPASTFAAKLRKKWQFAPDAIGMFEGPRDLSQRKGLSG